MVTSTFMRAAPRLDAPHSATEDDAATIVQRYLRGERARAMRKRKAADEIAHEKARRGTRQQQARKPQAPPRSFVRGAAVSSTHRSMAPSTQIIVRNAAPDTSQSSVSLTLWREPCGRANLVYPHFNHSYQQRLEELRGRRLAPHRRASIARSHAELRPKQPSSGSNLSTSAFRGAPSGVCARGCRGCARCRIAELVEKASQRAQQAGWICDEHSKERATQATPPHVDMGVKQR